MKNKIAEIRLTLYALISAIETDLRHIIRKEIITVKDDLSFLKDRNVKKKVVSRFEKDYQGLNAKDNIADLIEYLDFQESYKTILENRDIIPNKILQEVKKLSPQLDSISTIRNRVMHARPLMAGDFSIVYSFVNEVIPEKRIEWDACQQTIRKMETDPSFIFSFKIPTDFYEESHIFHNLPMPDFDESGFIGREEDTKQVKKLLLGNNRVVSILGDGGIGKSALILKVAYDIIDLKEECPFDAIIWTSAKTSMLTPSGIEEIRNSLRDFTGFIEKITKNLGAPISGIDTNIEEILEFFDEFEVLLIIDNLETILEDSIRGFIREAQQRCKIAITSRVGLGELEFPRKLMGLTEQESTVLIREISKVRNSEVLFKLPNSKLAKISKQLHFNPLAIKWFVNSVDVGKSPKEVLNNKHDLLNYCLTNVYNNLSEDAKLILATVLSTRRPLNEAEIHFLTGLKPIRMRKALNSLFVTTLARRDVPSNNDISECLYSVTDFTKSYLLSNYPPKKDFVQSINKKIKKLSVGYEEAHQATSVNQFSFKALEIRNHNEKVICRYLLDALKLSRPKYKKFGEAIDRIDQAKEIVPNYFEIYRVSGFIKSFKGDLLGAEEDYKIALELEPNNVRLLFFYAGFLLYQMDDVSSAIPYAQKAYEIDNKSPETIMIYARCLGYLGEYEQAINLLEGAHKEDKIASVKSRKIITTLIINFYRRWANRIVELNSDYATAINKLTCAVELFKQADTNYQIDYQMIKDFSECVLWLIVYSKNSEDENLLNSSIATYRRFENYVNQTRYSLKIRDLVQENIAECYLSGDQKRYTGIVKRKFAEKRFAFLESEVHGELYFNSNSFINKNEWNKMAVGTKIEYSLGSNEIGECALGIKIYNI